MTANYSKKIHIGCEKVSCSSNVLLLFDNCNCHRKLWTRYCICIKTVSYVYAFVYKLLISYSLIDWIGLSSVLRPRQHSIGYMGDGFYRSEDPTNSTKVLKVHIVRLVYTNMGLLGDSSHRGQGR